MNKIPVDTVAVGKVDACVNRKENVESIQVVLRDEEISEDPVAVEGCVISADIHGNEVPGAMDVVVAVFTTESNVDLGGIKVWDSDIAGTLLHTDVFVGLDTDREPVGRS